MDSPRSRLTAADPAPGLDPIRVDPIRAAAPDRRPPLDPAVAAVRVAVRELLSAADRDGLLDTGTVAVACSGGADSLALAAAVRHESRHRDLAVHGLVVDHGLQDGSAAVAATAAAQLRALGVTEVTVLAPQVAGPGGPEAAARRARYDALAAARPPGSLVLLGHTLDDQAETVLLGLGRGSGLRSIAGMRPLDPPWARPLLGVTRATTRRACAALGLDPWSDPHNADPRFTRARLRHEVLPLLEDVLHGGVAAALARTAAQLTDDGAALDELAEQALLRAVRAPRGCGEAVADGAGAAASVATWAEPPGEPAHSADPPGEPRSTRQTQTGEPANTADFEGGFSSELLVEALDGVHPAVRRRVVRRWLLGSGVPAVSDQQLRSVDALIGRWRGQGPVTVRFGLVVVRSHGRLQLKLAKRTEGK